MRGARQFSAVAPLLVGQKLFEVRNVNMAIQDADSAFTRLFNGSIWIPTLVVARLVSGAFNTSCAGGVYTAVAKGGTAIVAASQSYSGLTGANTITRCTLAAVTNTDAMTSATLFVNLTDNNAAALVADFFVYGVVLA